MWRTRGIPYRPIRCVVFRKRRAEKRSAFRRFERSGILLVCRVIAAIGFRGGTFFTVNLRDPRSDLFVTQIDMLRDAVRRVRARTPFRIDAWVVLPDHMHCLWTLPQGDADFPGRWRAIKTAFVKCLRTGDSRSPMMTSRGDRDFAAHMGHTHFNPVKHGLVEHPADWPHSSFRRGWRTYPDGWRGGSDKPQATGERL
jgi:putative transposase